MIAALLALPLVALAAYLLTPLPLPADGPVPAVQYFDRHGRLLYEGLEGAAGAQETVRLADLSPFVAQATVAVEDASFYDNPGVDVTGLVRAAVQNLRAGRIVAGGSTITQQLARLLYFSPEERAAQTFDRKLRELALALRLTRSLAKDDILEQYLNRVYYGGLAYGIEAASRRVFGKPARDLDLAEAALLAGLPQSPAAYDPFQHPEAAQARQRTVLGLMARAGMITAEQEQAAAAEPLRFAPAAFPIRAPHFVQYVRTLLDDLVGPERAAAGGLRVVTTLDLDLQETAEAIVQRRLAELREKQVTNAAVVALDPATGELLALVGSADYFDRGIDGAVNMALALRQPGSAIKPVTYALALQRGFTAASTLYDLPTTFTTRNGLSYRPHNYDGVFRGPVTVREALARSLNLPAVAVLRAVGVEDMTDLARRMGLGTLNDPARYDLSLTLGGGEVRLLDLTAAFAVFAAGGVARAPVAVLRVEDTAGSVLYRHTEREGRRVLPAGVAAIITDILADNEARAPAFGAQSVLRLDRPAAAKTGTTEDFRDNWTVGYTPGLVVGVWTGNADNTAMRESSGVTGAAPIWHDVMTAALQGMPPQPFVLPPELERVAVCDPWGLRPGPACPTVREELFLPGTAPRETEQVYRLVEECRVPGLVLSQCPSGQTRRRVVEELPPEAQAWGRWDGAPGTGNSETGGEAAGVPPVRVRFGGLEPGATLHLTRELPPEAQRMEIEVIVAGLQPARVELWDGGTLVHEWREPPYRTSWQLQPGRHAFTALAVDADGRPARSVAAEIVVVGP